jgi:hypothetical protein
MNAVQFFLEQYNTVRIMVDDLVFTGLSEEQLGQAPAQIRTLLHRSSGMPAGGKTFC